MSPEFIRFVRFLAVGGLNTGFGYAAYAALVLAGSPLWLAVAGSTVLGMVFNFYSYGGLVFGSTSVSLLRRFVLFYVALGVANYFAIKGLALIEYGPLIAQALLIPLRTVISFFGMRLLVYREPGRV